MIVINYAIASFVSSFLFVQLISLSYFDSLNYFELTDFLVIWGFFVLPVFLIGSLITLCVDTFVQNTLKSKNYFISLTIFIVFGITCNIYALNHLIRNGWDEGVMEYLILGVVGSVLYYHIWLLLNKVFMKIKADLQR